MIFELYRLKEIFLPVGGLLGLVVLKLRKALNIRLFKKCIKKG